MTDRTNAPYDPDAAETSHEWAARVGQEHDTWHRPDDGETEPPPAELTIESLTPSTVLERQHTIVTIRGTGFTFDSVVWSGLTTYPSTFISDTELTFDPYEMSSGTRQVRVENFGGATETLPLIVTDVPLPSITATVPTGLSQAAGIATVVVTGSNFVSGAAVQLNSIAMPTTFVSTTELSAQVDPTAVGIAGQNMSVLNPDGGKSPGVPFQITA